MKVMKMMNRSMPKMAMRRKWSKLTRTNFALYFF